MTGRHSPSGTESGVEARIASWRGFVGRRAAISTADVDELEAHLRDQMGELESVGLSEDEAFLIAVGRLGEVDALSRELAVPIFRLEEWRDRALTGIDVGLKERENDPIEQQLNDANRRIGELVMEVEILRKERQVKRPLVGRRSSR